MIIIETLSKHKLSVDASHAEFISLILDENEIPIHLSDADSLLNFLLSVSESNTLQPSRTNGNFSAWLVKPSLVTHWISNPGGSATLNFKYQVIRDEQIVQENKSTLFEQVELVILTEAIRQAIYKAEAIADKERANIMSVVEHSLQSMHQKEKTNEVAVAKKQIRH